MKKLLSLLLVVSLCISNFQLQMNTIVAEGTVTGISGTSSWYDQLTVSWNHYTYLEGEEEVQADSYAVTLNNNGGTKTTGANSATFTGLEADTTYSINVTASYGGSVVASGTGSGTTDDYPNPESPSGLSASQITSTSAVISWSPGAYANAYRIQGAGLDTTTSNTQYTISSLTPGTSYHVTVTSLRDELIGGSDSVSFSTRLGTPSVSATVTSESSVDVDWSSVEGASDYLVTIASISYSETTAATSTSITGLSPNETYTVSVKAQTNDVVGSAGTATFTTDLPEPSPPGTVSASEVSQTGATISWSSVTYATSYVFTGPQGVEEVTGTQIILSNLNPDTGYTVSVAAKNASGTSTATSASFTTLIPAPGTPTGYTAGQVTETTAQISWTGSAYADYYEVNISSGGSSVASGSPTGTSFSASGLSPSTTYQVSIRAVNDEGISSALTGNFTTLTPLPGVPSLGGVSGITESSAVISWSSVPYADSYTVTIESNVYSGITGTSYTASGLTSQTDYSYSVKAVNSQGEGPASSGSFTTLIPLPGPVSDLKTTSIQTNQAALSWQSGSGATSYRISIGGESYTSSTSSYTITGLDPASNYNVTVYSLNARGESTGVSLSFTTATPLPEAPSNLTISDIGQSSAKISWTGGAYADAYRVTVGGQTFNNISGNQLDVSGLDPVTEYSVQVYSVNDTGTSDGASASFTTLAPPPPDVPGNLQTSSQINSVSISWFSSEGAEDYSLELRDGTNITQRTTASTSYTFSGLDPSTEYEVRLRANGLYTSSDYSTWMSITTLTPPPNTPESVTAVASVTSVTLSWTGVSDADSYDINFDGRALSTQATSYTINDLEPDRDYTYRVRAVNTFGNSEYSELKTVRTKVPLPEPPAGISSTVTETSMKVSWTPVENAQSYDVNIDGTVHNTENTSITFDSLIANTLYKIKVRGKNATGNGEYSSIYEISTLQYMPGIPTGLQGNATEYEITLSWDSVEYAKSYTIIFDGVSYETSSTLWVVENLQPYSLHTYKMRANNGRGSSDYTSEKSLRTLQILPLTPDGVQASSSSRSVDINWTSVERATGYEVLFNGRTYTVSGTEFSADNLTPETTYDYAVRSVNQAGKSDYSEIKRIRTDSVLPYQPDIKDFSSTDTTISISWFKVSNADSYQVVFNGDTFDTYNTSMTFKNLDPDRAYTIKVRGFNDKGYGSYSGEETVITDEAVVLSLPVPVNVTASSTSSTIKLAWDQVQGASSYEININGKLITTRLLTYTFTGLEPDTNYDYMIRGISDTGVGLFSDLDSIRTLVGRPGKVSGLKATTTEAQVLISWDDLEGATSYEIYFEDKVIKSDVSELTLRGLAYNADYEIKVRGLNSAGSGPYSEVLSFRTSLTKPETPSGISATAREDAIVLIWNDVEFASYYEINIDGQVFRVTRSYLTVTGLDSNTEYRYSIRSGNDAGTSSYSDAALIVTAKALSEIVITNPVAGTITEIQADDQWTVKWTELEKAVRYIISIEYLNRDEEIINIETDQLSYTLEAENLWGGRYNIQLEAYDSEDDLIGQGQETTSLSKKLSGVYPDGSDVHLDQSNQLEIGFEPLNLENVSYKVTLTDVISGEDIYSLTNEDPLRLVEGDLFVEDPTNVRMTLEAIMGQVVIADFTTDIRVFAKLNRAGKPTLISDHGFETILTGSSLDLAWLLPEENIPDTMNVSILLDGVGIYHQSITVDGPWTIPGEVFGQAGTYIVGLKGLADNMEDSLVDYLIVYVLESKDVIAKTRVATTGNGQALRMNGRITYINKERIKSFGFEYGNNQLMSESCEVSYIQGDGTFTYPLRSLGDGDKIYYRAYVKLLDGSTIYGQVMTGLVPESEGPKPEILEIKYKEKIDDNQTIIYTVTTDLSTQALIFDNGLGGIITYRSGYVEFDQTRIWTIERFYRNGGVYQESLTGLSECGYSNVKSVNLVTGIKANTKPILQLKDQDHQFFVGTLSNISFEGQLEAQGEDLIKKITYVIGQDDESQVILEKSYNQKVVDLTELQISTDQEIFMVSGRYLVKIFVETKEYGSIGVSMGQVLIDVKNRIVLEDVRDEIPLYQSMESVHISGIAKSMDGAMIDGISIVFDDQVIKVYEKPWLPIGRTSLVEIDEDIDLEDLGDISHKELILKVLLDSGYTYTHTILLYESQIHIEKPQEIHVGDKVFLRVYTLDSMGNKVLLEQEISLLSGESAIVKTNGNQLEALKEGQAVITVLYAYEGVNYQKQVSIEVNQK